MDLASSAGTVWIWIHLWPFLLMRSWSNDQFLSLIGKFWFDQRWRQLSAAPICALRQRRSLRCQNTTTQWGRFLYPYCLCTWGKQIDPCMPNFTHLTDKQWWVYVPGGRAGVPCVPVKLSCVGKCIHPMNTNSLSMGCIHVGQQYLKKKVNKTDLHALRAHLNDPQNVGVVKLLLSCS